MNGLIATLENCDWSMLQLFDELSLRHYKEKNWPALIRSKFRLRFAQPNLGVEICSVLTSNQKVSHSLFRIERNEMLALMLRSGISLPITPDNIVFICNHLFIRNPELDALAPIPVRDELERKHPRSNIG